MTEEAKERKREYSKEKYHFYKSKGICTHCWQEKAVKGKTRCPNCADDESVRYYMQSSKWTEEERKAINLKNSARQKERYQKRKEAGLCPSCGKRKPESGYVNCKYCRFRNRKKAERCNRKKGVLPRILFGDGEHCVYCGKEVNGVKVCESCKVKRQRTLEKARLTSKNSVNPNHWHNTNINLFGDENAD